MPVCLVHLATPVAQAPKDIKVCLVTTDYPVNEVTTVLAYPVCPALRVTKDSLDSPVPQV